MSIGWRLPTSCRSENSARVAEVVDDRVLEVDQQPGRRVDRALRRRRGVPGRDELDPAPVELHGAAEVRVTDVEPLLAELVGDLDDRHRRRRRSAWRSRPCRRCGRRARGSAGSSSPRRRRRRSPPSGCRVRNGSISTVVSPSDSVKHACPRNRTSILDHSSCVVGLSGPASSRASSKPTATPTSIPSRVSSASSVRTARCALLRIVGAGGLADRLIVGGVEPSALGHRRRQHALERRSRPHHEVLGLRQPTRIGDRVDRGIEVVVGVGAVHHSRGGSYVRGRAADIALPRGRVRLQAARGSDRTASGRPAADRRSQRARRLRQRRRRRRLSPARRPRARPDRRLLHPDRRRSLRLRADRRHQRALGCVRDGRHAGQRAQPRRILDGGARRGRPGRDPARWRRGRPARPGWRSSAATRSTTPSRSSGWP